MLRATWKWAKFIYAIIYGLLMMTLIGGICYYIVMSLIDQNALDNSRNVNSITLTIALISMPGLFVQLLSLFEINKKKEFTVTTTCPKCSHKVDLKMKEL